MIACKRGLQLNLLCIDSPFGPPQLPSAWAVGRMLICLGVPQLKSVPAQGCLQSMLRADGQIRLVLCLQDMAGVARASTLIQLLSLPKEAILSIGDSAQTTFQSDLIQAASVPGTFLAIVHAAGFHSSWICRAGSG